MSALSRDDLDALRAAAGPDAVDVSDPGVLDDAKLAATIAPADEAALARSVAALADRGIAAAIEGGGTRAAFGNPMRDVAVRLSTRRLDGVVEMDAEEGVALVRAGTRLADARAAIEAHGWLLPMDPPGDRTTLGGVLAASAVGPRHLGWGRPRDLVLGLGVVLGDGVATRCGGRVVKNVTGYDLMKLHVGACGAFGVVTSAWLRLEPRPEVTREIALALDDGAESAARAVAIARSPTARACVLADRRVAAAVAPTLVPSSGWLLVVECAGDEAAVARDVSRLVEIGGTDVSSGDALSRARSFQGETSGACGLRFRLAVLPSALESAAAALHREGFALLVHPGTGLVHARFELDRDGDGAGLDRAWRAVRAAAAAGGGHAVLEAAPLWARRHRDVFGDATDEWRLARLAKTRFDPRGVLNPGRFVGGI